MFKIRIIKQMHTFLVTLFRHHFMEQCLKRIFKIDVLKIPQNDKAIQDFTLIKTKALKILILSSKLSKRFLAGFVRLQPKT